MFAVYNTKTNSTMWSIQKREGAIKRAQTYATAHQVTIEIREDGQTVATVLADGVVVEQAAVQEQAKEPMRQITAITLQRLSMSGNWTPDRFTFADALALPEAARLTRMHVALAYLAGWNRYEEQRPEPITEADRHAMLAEVMAAPDEGPSWIETSKADAAAATWYPR